jgi:hypothetical protein
MGNSPGASSVESRDPRADRGGRSLARLQEEPDCEAVRHRLGLRRHGRLGRRVGPIGAIAESRTHGIVVLLVTGRILDELRRVAGDLHFVDGVIAENGAVIHFPDSGRTSALAPLVPEGVVAELRRRGIPFTARPPLTEREQRHQTDGRSAGRKARGSRPSARRLGHASATGCRRRARETRVRPGA